MPLRAGTRPSLGKRKPSNYPIEFNIFNTYPINSLLNPINSLLNPYWSPIGTNKHRFCDTEPHYGVSILVGKPAS